MKTPLALIATSLLSAFTACHTSSSSTSVTPSAPTNTLNITINGHSYHITGHSTGSHVTPYFDLSGTTVGAGSIFEFSMTGNDVTAGNKINLRIGGWKTDMSSATGTYYNGYDSSSSGITWPGGYPGNSGTIQVVDYGDGGKAYSNLIGVYAGQKSTVTVTVSNSTELKGTFNLNLSYNGTIYNITGDFDYNH